MSKFYLLFLLFYFSFVGFSQLPHPRIDKLGENKGLFLTNEVCDVEMDSKGNIWVITFSEIFKYDGTTFQEIKSSNVKHGSFFKFYESHNHQPYVTGLNGEIYFISSDSLKEYKHNHLIRKVKRNDKPVDVITDSAFNVYLTFLSEEILTIKNDKVSHKIFSTLWSKSGTRIMIRDGLPPSYTSIRINPSQEKINESKVYLINTKNEILDSSLLFGANGQYRNIAKLKNKNYLIATNSEYILEVSDSAIENKIKFEPVIINMLIDRDSNLWISTKKKGVFFYEKSLLTKANEKRYYENTSLIVSAEDRSGGLWLYSEKEGVFRVANPWLTYYSSEKTGLQTNKIEVLKLLGDSLLFVDQPKKISILNHQSNKLEYLNNIANNKNEYWNDYNLTVKDIDYDAVKNRLWVCNSEKILYRESEKWKSLKLDERLKEFWLQGKMLGNATKNSNISVAGISRNQFFLCKDTSITYVSKEFSHRLKDLLILEDTIFINARNGLYKVIGDDYLYYGNKFSELDKELKDWCFFKNETWVSSNAKGVFILKKDSLIPFTYKGYKITNARFVKQNEQTLWLISDLGTFEVNNTGENYKIEAYRALPKTYFTAIENNSKTIFAGTKKEGILQVDFKDLKKHPLVSPSLIISAIKVGGSLFKEVDVSYTTVYNKSGVQLWFNTIDYSTRPISFRYRLNGLEKSWVYNNQGYLNYPNLDDGVYKLELQVRKGIQPWSKSRIIEIKVLPPIWERWWFILLITLFLLLIIYNIIAYRIKIYNKEKNLTIARLKAEQKALRTKMEPHFIFNVISSLQYLVVNNKNEKASLFLEQFSALMRTTLDHTNREYVSIAEELDFVKKYVEIEKFRLEDKFDFNLQISNQVKLETQIPNFLIQPFVENAIQHGLKNKEAKGHLKVSVSEQRGMLKVEIEDDGVGYNRTISSKKHTKKRHKSHGISTVKARLLLTNKGSIKNSLKIEDLKNNNELQTGTRVTLFIKMKK